MENIDVKPKWKITLVTTLSFCYSWVTWNTLTSNQYQNTP